MPQTWAEAKPPMDAVVAAVAAVPTGGGGAALAAGSAFGSMMLQPHGQHIRAAATHGPAPCKQAPGDYSEPSLRNFETIGSIRSCAAISRRRTENKKTSIQTILVLLIRSIICCKKRPKQQNGSYKARLTFTAFEQRACLRPLPRSLLWHLT